MEPLGGLSVCLFFLVLKSEPKALYVVGCLNGRGQAQTEDGHTDRALLQQMEGIYSGIPVWPPESSTHVQELYQEWLEGTESPKVQEVLHTSYQSLEPCTDSLDIKW